ncbi:MAG: hypothetical protein JW702_05075 [Clostridiales bacterium]|nr:hypothetical protein [Clostridiales bacterium]
MIRGIIDFFQLNWHKYHYTEEKILEYQWRKIKKIVDFAKKNSEFYASRYDVKTLEEFKSLSVINKKILMESFDKINTCGIQLDEVQAFAVEKELNKDYTGYYEDKYVIGLSSGTSGNKGIYITSKALTKRLPFVFLARSGIPLKLLPFRILFLLRVYSQGFDDINAPFAHLNYLSTMTPIEKIIEKIKREKINILMAPPSLIRLLLPHNEEIKNSIKMIVTYAEVLEIEEKERFERYFNTSVIEIYQASEGQMASACKHGNLHINEDLVYVELYDENGKEIVKPNIISNKMIVTNLINYDQPLIRYEMNDLLMLDEPCSCGSNFRVIKKIIGRNDDVLFFRNDFNEKQHVFPDLMSRWIITSSDSIREFQVFQLTESSIKIVIDVMDNAEKNSIVEKLKKRLEYELLSFNIKIAIEIIIDNISMPANNMKSKRFFVK